MPANVPPSAIPVPLPDILPETPTAPADFLQHLAGNPQLSAREAVAPYVQHEAALRAFFAQAPDHPFVASNTVNLVDLYANDGHADICARERNLETEAKEEKDRFVMELQPEQRKKTGDRVLVPTLKEFQKNFAIFTEGALANLGM
jgi:hypothetical protein